MNAVDLLAEYGHVDLSAVKRPPLTAEQRPAAELLRRWTLLEIPGVFVYGPVGTGKTQLAMRAGERMQRRGIPVLFVRTKRLLDDLRDLDYAADLRQTVYDAEALIFDDLGAARDTEFATEELCAIFDHRYDHGQSTVITSNLNGSQLAKRYGDRVFSRIRGLCESVEVAGKDLRQ